MSMTRVLPTFDTCDACRQQSRCIHDGMCLGTRYIDSAQQQKDEPGHKFDAGKSRVDLIPPEFIEGIGHVFAYGANKYGERNFEKGMSWGRIIGGLLRHTLAFMWGEENDPETGKPHTWHMGCCVAMLEFHRSRNVGTDDRSKR